MKLEATVRTPTIPTKIAPKPIAKPMPSSYIISASSPLISIVPSDKIVKNNANTANAPTITVVIILNFTRFSFLIAKSKKAYDVAVATLEKEKAKLASFAPQAKIALQQAGLL